ncbi:MAG TPA: FlgD immunoglobulin-like domain containing protein [Candidatus Cloacimonadota bacterium]|nr:FlgD immunoglobulin-like domain containing protein [Candidatus Cloacimonadota bacterium]HPT71399.1 FlgD immunoglobulin-like domain containing protein [Candidatus Cloacimonadota bacterium]
MKGLLVFFVFIILSIGILSAQENFVSDAFAYWNLTWNGNCSDTEGPIFGTPVVRGNPDPVPALTYSDDHGVASNGWDTATRDTTRYYEYTLTSTADMTMVCFYLTMETTNPNMHGTIHYSFDGFASDDRIMPTLDDYSFSGANPYHFYWGALYARLWNGMTITIRSYAWGTTDPNDIFYNKLLYMCGHTYDSTLPVELATFTATTPNNGNVTLNWTTHSETDVLGYSVYRNSEIFFNTATCLSQSQGLIPAYNESTTHNYSFIDNEVGIDPAVYYYWLQYTEFSGATVTNGPIRVVVNNGDVPSTPSAETSLQSVGPNPFQGKINIKYGLKRGDIVSLNVYNIKGQLVKKLVPSEYKDANDYTANWDGRDSRGSRCSAGVYYIEMQTSSNHTIKKVVKIAD